jgi:large subunit ribosomal protein L3
MPTIRNPRHGSLQYWPRKRAKRIYPRIRHYPEKGDVKMIGFAGYKVEMTHAMVVDNRKHSTTKGEEIMMPITIVECPPLKVIAIRMYKKTAHGLRLATEVFTGADKTLARKLKLPKNDSNKKLEEAEKKVEEYADIRLQVCTQPGLTSIGKKKPEVFEIAVGGDDVRAKLEYAKKQLGKEIKIRDVLREGEQVDVHAVTKGKGYQGPVKRFGVSLRSHKSEKGRRGPANLGPWTGNRSWTVAHAGQTGLHSRMQRNNWIIKIAESLENINPRGGFKHYGLIKNSYVIIKGSVQGTPKRLLRLTPASRPNKKLPEEVPIINTINTV